MPIEPGLSTWFGDLAVLLRREDIIPADATLGRPALKGSRSEYSYRWMTEQISSALRPFRPHGLLHAKITGRFDVPRFALERLAGLNKELTLRPTRSRSFWRRASKNSTTPRLCSPSSSSSCSRLFTSECGIRETQTFGPYYFCWTRQGEFAISR